MVYSTKQKQSNKLRSLPGRNQKQQWHGFKITEKNRNENAWKSDLQAQGALLSKIMTEKQVHACPTQIDK